MTTTKVEDIGKDIGNTLYNSLLIAVATAGSRYLTKMAGMKDRPIEFKLKSVGALALDIGVGSMIVKRLHDNKILPDKIFT